MNEPIDTDVAAPDDLVYEAWVVIANVDHKQGGWDAQDPEWVEAAIRWRDRFLGAPGGES